MPPLPTARQLGKELPLLREAKVRLTIFWGHGGDGSIDSIEIKFYEWLKILNGGAFKKSMHTFNEWPIRLDWKFNNYELAVDIDDGGGAWYGNCFQLDNIVGPELNGTDLAQLVSLAAKQHMKSNKTF